MQTLTQSPIQALSSPTVGFREELQNGSLFRMDELALGDLHGRIVTGRDSLWLLLQRGHGGIGIRVGYAMGQEFDCRAGFQTEDHKEFALHAAFGVCRAILRKVPGPGGLLRVTISLEPKTDLALPFWPRDLYPFSENGDPGETLGEIIAAQRGVNSGLVYFALKRPSFGTVLYFQDLTSLNPFFEATETKPDSVVGGEWPELGYLMPATQKPLPKGRETVVADFYLSVRHEIQEDAREKSRVFLEMLSDVYPHIQKPETELRDWPKLAKATLRDLERSEKVRQTLWNCTFLRPYVDAEVPDSMTQVNTVAGLAEYERWLKRPVKEKTNLEKGITRFYDSQLGMFGRYLPHVKGKDPDEVDTWYLFHPLSNLARLAIDGDGAARELLDRSIDYAIRAGRRFDYRFPVKFKASDLTILQMERQPGQPGQSDAAGLYAALMVQMHDLTKEERYLEEAARAIRAVHDLGFDLPYQLNLSAWGLAACVGLWKATGDEYFLLSAMAFGAPYFHNCLLWESEIGQAKHYTNFLGASSLHDGPYMSMFECHDSYEAFSDALRAGHDSIPEPLRLLMTEYIRFVTSRAWFYYPQNLPKESLAKEIRNGHLDPKLAFPLEDLYGDGQPAGQVGQEVYGASAPFTFLNRSFFRLEKMPWILFCEHPLVDLKESTDGVTAKIIGSNRTTCGVYLIPKIRGRLFPAEVWAGGEKQHVEEAESEMGPCLRAIVQSDAELEIRRA